MSRSRAGTPFADMSRRIAWGLGVLVCAGIAGWWFGSVRLRPGTLVFWTDVRGGGALEISVNGRPAGALTEYFSTGDPPGCDAGRGVLTVSVGGGLQDVRASDGVGRAWRRRLAVQRGECAVVRLAPHGAPVGVFSIPADSGA